ncbi:unnamed protein product [Nesidiocoris tenuis]|uniref:Defective in cullin neddylation protein n=1 Tax=Nesidiocoris tenuis TaxID=355587 RepID=A0A6H5HKG3_9HEMI|nr:unnamed protein product [Nesidiocoris tenuis]
MENLYRAQGPPLIQANNSLVRSTFENTPGPSVEKTIYHAGIKIWNRKEHRYVRNGSRAVHPGTGEDQWPHTPQCTQADRLNLNWKDVSCCVRTVNRQFSPLFRPVVRDSPDLPYATVNGNNIYETAAVLAVTTASVATLSAPTVITTTTALSRDRSVRTFYARMPSVGKTAETRIGKTVSDAKVNSLFDSYKDPHEDLILTEGIERLCADLSLSPDDFKVLILAWKLDAGQMCRFTRDEFVGGCRSLGVESVRAIKEKLPEIATQVASNPDVFKDLYRFTFRFGLDNTVGQRILPIETAVILWRLVFTVREPPILERWLRFLDKHRDVFRGVPRDTWNMFLNFSEAVGDDLSVYDDTEAWPSVFDDFVEFDNDQANQNISNKDKDSDCIVR